MNTKSLNESRGYTSHSVSDGCCQNNCRCWCWCSLVALKEEGVCTSRDLQRCWQPGWAYYDCPSQQTCHFVKQDSVAKDHGSRDILGGLGRDSTMEPTNQVFTVHHFSSSLDLKLNSRVKSPRPTGPQRVVPNSLCQNHSGALV